MNLMGRNVEFDEFVQKTKMDSLKGRYVYKGDDVAFITILKIEHTVSLLAQKENRPFDEVYADFLESSAYEAIQETRSLMWYENAEFIVDEYYREKPRV